MWFEKSRRQKENYLQSRGSRRCYQNDRRKIVRQSQSIAEEKIAAPHTQVQRLREESLPLARSLEKQFSGGFEAIRFQPWYDPQGDTMSENESSSSSLSSSDSSDSDSESVVEQKSEGLQAKRYLTVRQHSCLSDLPVCLTRLPNTV